MIGIGRLSIQAVRLLRLGGLEVDQLGADQRELHEQIADHVAQLILGGALLLLFLGGHTASNFSMRLMIFCAANHSAASMT